jgi:periplasmic divalent cation tolerance protein
MSAEAFGVISTTLAARDDAERLASVLLSEKLAACVQILSVDSRYVWKEEVRQEPEFLLLIKTRTALFETVIARVRAVHPYETPQIVATPFAAGFAGYLDWIAANTRSG